MNQQIIDKLEELRAIVGGEGLTSLTFSVNVDQSGVTYSLSTSEPDGRIRNSSDRVPNPPATA